MSPIIFCNNKENIKEKWCSVQSAPWLEPILDLKQQLQCWRDRRVRGNALCLLAAGGSRGEQYPIRSPIAEYKTSVGAIWMSLSSFCKGMWESSVKEGIFESSLETETGRKKGESVNMNESCVQRTESINTENCEPWLFQYKVQGSGMSSKEEWSPLVIGHCQERLFGMQSWKIRRSKCSLPSPPLPACLLSRGTACAKPWRHESSRTCEKERAVTLVCSCKGF